MSALHRETSPPPGFFVAAREPGHRNPALPTWACDLPLPIRFLDPADCPPVERVPVQGVPGAFQLLNVLQPRECQQFIEITEALGYDPDAPVTLPHEVRHMCNVNWVVSEAVDGPIWSRCSKAIEELVSGPRAVGLNARFRCYRYHTGDFFKPHTDGSWPGSRVVDGRLVADAYGDRVSQMTFLLLLSDGYEGGRTLFFVPSSDGETREVAVRTPRGAALCFPHGFHPLHCLHAGEQVASGTKYMIRTDVLFQ